MRKKQVFGDLKQLFPVGDSWIFSSGRIILIAFYQEMELWIKFKYIELTEIMRQRGGHALAQTLNNLSEPFMIIADIELLKQRVVFPSEVHDDVINLFYSYKEVYH